MTNVTTTAANLTTTDQNHVWVLNVGCTFETGDVRIHRYRDNFSITHLENAGKRGKKVTTVNVSVAWRSGETSQDRYDALNALGCELEECTCFAATLNTVNYFNKLEETAGRSARFDTYTREERGVDVTPAGFIKFVLTTDKVHIEAEYGRFCVKDRTDLHNEPTLIPRDEAKRSVPKFYQWCQKNRALLETADFRTIWSAMQAEGIQAHHYCAVD